MAYVDWFVARARDKSNHVPRFRRTGSGRHGTWRWRSGTTSPSARQPRRSWTTWPYGRRSYSRRRPRPSAPRRRSTGPTAPTAWTTTLRTHRPAKEAAAAAGAASVAEVAGAVAEAAAGKNRTQTEGEDGARRLRRLVVTEKPRKTPAAVVVLWWGRPRRHSRREGAPGDDGVPDHPTKKVRLCGRRPKKKSAFDGI